MPNEFVADEPGVRHPFFGDQVWSERRRLTLIVAVSVIVHIGLLWRLSSIHPHGHRETAEPRDIEVILAPSSPAAPRTDDKSIPPTAPRFPPMRTERGPKTLHPEPNTPPLDIWLDRGDYVPDPPWRFGAPPPPRQPHGLNAPDTNHELHASFGIIKSQKLPNGDTLVRYEFADGRVRCFWVRNPNPLNEFDPGAVYVGGCYRTTGPGPYLIKVKMQKNWGKARRAGYVQPIKRGRKL